MFDRKLSGREVFLALLVLAVLAGTFGFLVSRPSSERAPNLEERFEVTVWDSQKNLVSEESEPPFEVVVNVKPGKVTDCFAAKSALVDAMRGAFDRSELDGKLSRVLFTAPGFLRASVGAADGDRIDWSSAAAGPTATWDALRQAKPYEDESGPLESRTWGVALPGCE